MIFIATNIKCDKDHEGGRKIYFQKYCFLFIRCSQRTPMREQSQIFADVNAALNWNKNKYSKNKIHNDFSWNMTICLWKYLTKACKSIVHSPAISLCENGSLFLVPRALYCFVTWSLLIYWCFRGTKKESGLCIWKSRVYLFVNLSHQYNKKYITQGAMEKYSNIKEKVYLWLHIILIHFLLILW